MTDQLTLDEIIDYMFDLQNVPQHVRLALVDAEGEAFERFRKNAVWFFSMKVKYNMSEEDTRALIRNMHYIQTPQENQYKRQMAYVSVQAIKERYGIDEK